MLAKSWGPYAWYFLHHLTLHKVDVKTFKEFIRYFHRCIPCPLCKNNFYVKLKNLDRHTDDLFRWTVIIHNNVNRTSYKRVLSIEEASRKHRGYNKKMILRFLKEFYHSNINYNKDNYINMLKKIGYMYPNETVRKKLIEFMEDKRILRSNKKLQWIYVFINIIKTN